MKLTQNYFRVLFFLMLFSAFSPVTGQKLDKTYSDLIARYTTDAIFLPRTMQTFPSSTSLPSPLKHFGTIIGAPGVMHHSYEIYDYYKVLAQKSNRMKMVTVFTSEEGRPINLLIISSPENLKNLETNKQNLNLLADPRKVDIKDVEKLISKTKPIYYINGGLHSTEMGSPEMLMELVFKLLVDESDAVKNIRDNVITLINPVSEPDGRDKQVDWYYRYTKNKTIFDDGLRSSAPYWGKYVFHDNNRDGLQVSQALTKAIFKVYYDYHPITMLDLHESVPLLYISTGTGPYNTYVDPITIGEWQVMANHDLTQVTAEGLPGAFTWGFYNGWWPGYAIWVANNHNGTGRFYETFGNAGANTFLRDLTDNNFAGDPVHSRQWYRPVPPTKKVYWSARNNVNYMETGVLAALSYTSSNGHQLLQNFYQKGVNNINYAKKGEAFAYVINKNQRDPNMAAYLINQLRVQGIDVQYRNCGDNKGEYVVVLNQPYSSFADALLSNQDYPKTAKHNPYDDISWTYGLMYGVDVKKLATDKDFSFKNLEPVTKDVVNVGNESGSGSNVIINYKAQNEVLPLLYKVASTNKNSQIAITTEAVKKDSLNRGSLIISDADENTISLIKSMGLDFIKTNSLPNVATRSVKLPRIAIYHNWYNTQAEGWARFTFDTRQIPYTSIDKDDLKKGDLNHNFDVILMPHTSGDVETMINGIDAKWGPMPYTKTDKYPNHGYPDSTEDMTGGPGFIGLANLKSFVESGGTIITLADATRMVASTGIVRELSPYSAGDLFHPGSIVTAKIRNNNNAIMNGYSDTTHVFRGNLQLYEVEKYNRNHMVLQYGTDQLKDEKVYEGKIMGMANYKPDSIAVAASKKEKKGKYVISGMVKNEDKIVGQGAIFDIPVGKGHVVSFTFNPLHRFLNQHDEPMLWNAILNWDVKPE
jgi:hypothetical protein